MPDSTEQPIYGIGHNNSPSQAELIQEQLAETHAERINRRDQLLAGVARTPTELDDETAGKVADFIRQITGEIKVAETARVAEKEPYLSGQRAVDGWFKKLVDPLDAAKKVLADRLTKYQRAVAEKERLRLLEEQRQKDEEARIAREKAEAVQAEAALAEDAEGADASRITIQATVADEQARIKEGDAASAAKKADAKPADLSRSRGSLGSVASLRRFWDFRNLNRNEIDLEALRPYLAIADIEKAVRGYIKANNPGPNQPFVQIAGVEVFENTSSQVR